MITTSFNSGAGQIELNIITAHESVATASQIGQLRYAFDQTPDTLSIDRVQALYTYMNVDLLQYDDGGNDLWDILLAEVESATVRSELSVVLPDGAFEFIFRIRKPDISLNERAGIVSIRLTPFINDSVSVQEVFNGISNKKQFRTTRGGVAPNFPQNPLSKFFPSVGVKEFIIEGLNKFFDNGFGNEFSSSKTDLGDDYTEFVYDDLVVGKKGFAMVEATVENGLDPAPFDEDTQIQGAGSIVVEDVTDFEFEGREPIDYQLVATGAGLSVLRRGDRVFFTGGSVIGVQVDLVRTIAGVVTAFISATEPTMPVNRGESVTISNWSYVRGLDPATLRVVDVLKDLAGIEGSIFGTGFSKNFYIHRLATDSPTRTLNYNEVIDFKPFNFDLSLGKSFVGQLSDFRQFNTEFFGQWPLNGENSGVPNLSPGRSNTNGNFGASKGIEIELASAYPLLNKGLVSSSEVNGVGIRGSDTNLEAVLTRNGLKSYFQSLNASADSIAVEFTVIGSQRVLPYELFQFDSRAPEKYRNKQFRITEVSYDFVRDTCKVKGYQISSVTTPVVDDPSPRVPPPRTPPPFSGDPIGILNRGIDDEDVDSISVEMFQSTRTGGSLLILNSLEREQGYFQDNEAGQYEVTLNNADVPDPDEAQFVGVNMLNRGQGDSFTQISIRTTSAITLTAGQSITIRNISGQFQALTVAQTVTTIASNPSNEPGTNSIVLVEPAIAQNFYQGTFSYVHLAGYTPREARFLFPVGVSEVPIQEGRINAPRGSFVYGSSPYNQEDQIVTKQAVTSLNVALTNVAGGLNAAASAITKLNTTVSNINGVVTAQSFALTEIKSNISNIDGQISAQSTALTLLNTRVVVAEGYIISNASAITAIQSNIDGIEGEISGQATAISSLQTNVSLIDGVLNSTAERVDTIEANITTIDGSITAISSDVSNVSVELDTATGEITKIQAKRALVVNAGGTVGEISLTADGLTGFSEIGLKASQVTIQNIFFDEAGAVYSNNFITSGGTVSSGIIDPDGATEGWAFDRVGKLYADQGIFRNGTYNGGTQTNITYTEPVIIFPRLSISRATGSTIEVLAVDAMSLVEITVTGGGAETVEVRGINPILVGGSRIQTRIILMNNIDASATSEVIIKNNSSAASAVNRIRTPNGGDFSLQRGQSVEMFYRSNNDTNDRWIIIGTNRIF